MAIVVEEDRKSGGGGNVVGVLVWLIVLGIIASAVYYLFFAQPELIDVRKPENVQQAEQISRLSLDPQAILNDPRFVSLKPYVTLPDDGEFGRTNPFLGFGAPPVPRR